MQFNEIVHVRYLDIPQLSVRGVIDTLFLSFFLHMHRGVYNNVPDMHIHDIEHSGINSLSNCSISARHAGLWYFR